MTRFNFMFFLKGQFCNYHLKYKQSMHSNVVRDTILNTSYNTAYNSPYILETFIRIIYIYMTHLSIEILRRD